MKTNGPIQNQKGLFEVLPREVRHLPWLTHFLSPKPSGSITRIRRTAGGQSQGAIALKEITDWSPQKPRLCPRNVSVWKELSRLTGRPSFPMKLRLLPE